MLPVSIQYGDIIIEKTYVGSIYLPRKLLPIAKNRIVLVEARNYIKTSTYFIIFYLY